jgi:predicted amidohydrolase YtcJ
VIATLAFIAAAASTVGAQVPAALVSYPEVILYNGKIVTVDNDDFTANVGTIAQAIAVRQGKVLAVGANAEIRALAGPKTQQIDLKGRTVLPGLIATHEHPADWAMISPVGFGRVITDDSRIVARYLTGTPEEQLAKLKPAIVEAVSKAKPGQWIRIYHSRGYFKEWAGPVGNLFTKAVNRQALDQLSPNNPLIVRAGTGAIVNTLAMEAVLPKLDYFSEEDMKLLKESGAGGTDLQRYVDADSLMQGDTALLGAIYKSELEYWGSIGVTAFASAAYSPAALKAFRHLDDKGDFPLRTGWAYLGPDFSMSVLETLAPLVGTGTDHVWMVGAWPTDNGGSCTTIDAKPAVKSRERCNFEPGSRGYQEMYNIIKSGLRVATMHTGGDKDIDYYMDIIEKASKDAGFTIEEIRAKRHAFDHMALAPRPDQYPRLKNLNMLASGTTTFLYNHADEVAAQYGEEYTNWVVPRRRLTDNGIRNTFETDTPLSQHGGTIFEVAVYDLTRKSKTGKVHAPGQRLDKGTLLKTLTTWGAYYLLKEDVIGSLEPGKFADLIIVDRDYLAIPDEEVGKIQILGTMVGGKFIFLERQFAAGYGMTPVGYQKP